MEPETITIRDAQFAQNSTDGIHFGEDENVILLGRCIFYATPEQIAAPVVCPVCGHPSNGDFFPCGHSLENVRKCN